MSVYRLDELGWYQFERLCQALLKTAYGAALEVWGGTSGDLGRDAYSGGQLRYPDPKVIQEGPFVFQVKHVAGANAAGADPMPALIKAVSRERARIVARLESGAWKPPRFYTLLTNVNFTPDARDQVAKIIQDSIPESEIVTTGAADIEAMLDANPSIRSAYPQVLGIRDLEALIKDAVAADVTLRSAVSLQAAEDLSRVFVATTAYFRAIHVLSQHAFVVLTGPPEMGKTAIARMIALAKATDGWDPIDCRNSADIFRTYDPQRNQLFLADDAFGSTEYRADLASEWATDLDRIIDLGNASHWVVLTSRPGPLREGLSRLHFQGSAKKFPSPAEVQVDTERLSVAEKAQMLYRHAKAAQLSDEVTGIVKTQATQIVHNDHFTPLRIERLVTEQLPIVAAASADRRDDALRAAIVSGLEQPTQQMRTSLVALTEEHRCLLYALLAEETTPQGLTVWKFKSVTI